MVCVKYIRRTSTLPVKVGQGVFVDVLRSHPAQLLGTDKKIRQEVDDLFSVDSGAFWYTAQSTLVQLVADR